MAEEIRIKRKAVCRGEDESRVVSVRMRDELIARLDDLSAKTNRSRNELIGLALDFAKDKIQIDPEE